MAKGLNATWSTHSDLPHRSRQGCNFSLTECQESPQDVFSARELLLLMRDAVFWGVSSDFLRFRQSTDPLAVIELH